MNVWMNKYNVGYMFNVYLLCILLSTHLMTYKCCHHSVNFLTARMYASILDSFGFSSLSLLAK